jgi:hypothetical protein
MILLLYRTMTEFLRYNDQLKYLNKCFATFIFIKIKGQTQLISTVKTWTYRLAIIASQ